MFSHRAGRCRPGGHCFRLQVVEVVDVWRDLLTGDRNLSSPGAAGSWNFFEGQLQPRAPRPLGGQGRAGEDARPMGLGLGKRRD